MRGVGLRSSGFRACGRIRVLRCFFYGLGLSSEKELPQNAPRRAQLWVVPCILC